MTVVARVADLSATREVLAKLTSDRAVVAPGTNPQPKLFADPDLGVHFGRVVLLEERADSPWRSSLVLESNFDSTDANRARATRRHLEALVEKRGKELGDLFAGCSFEKAKNRSLADKLVSAIRPSTAEYMGRVHRDLDRVRAESAALDVALDVVSGLPAGTPIGTLRDRVREELKKRASNGIPLLTALNLDGPAPALPDPKTRAQLLDQEYQPWITNAFRTIGGNAALGALLFLPTGLVWGPWVWFMLRRAKHDPEFDMQREAELRSDTEAAVFRENDESEDHVMHNALTHLVPLKKVLGKSLSLRFLHRYVGLMARNYFNYIEQLGGIPSIHFAKWLLIDEDERLLFLSNYDASWESYLGDFVDQAAIGLNLAWCLTEKYPKVKGVFADGGANDEERFKAWARAHQRPTQLFYSAEPTRSLSSINNATWFRQGLHSDQSVDGEWLRRLT